MDSQGDKDVGLGYPFWYTNFNLERCFWLQLNLLGIRQLSEMGVCIQYTALQSRSTYSYVQSKCDSK